jgi:YebC/PmpR family DNA-binding regulatory protein
MSGHSKWAGIKHHKAAQDSKKGKIFTKLIREISMAARTGGGNPENNASLRTAISAAREANMPSDNVTKAIKRGTGDLPGVVYEEVGYEGYGPGGVAVLCVALTDNKNRTTAEIRKIFSKHGGNLGETGCVGWMFSQKGFITIDRKKYGEDELMTLALDLGAEDFSSEDEDVYEIITSAGQFESILDSLKKKNITTLSAEVTMLPKNYIKLTDKPAEQMLNLMTELEDNDDISHVYANFDISKEIMEKVSA